jgi:exopolysaccharide biosynthesis polyprenyl glycosylphosphotransferase
MLGRKQEINLQFYQIVDGVLLVMSFWAAWVLRYCATDWFQLSRPIGGFNEFRWMLFIIMPFGPIILDMQGYYSFVLQKTLRKSFLQILNSAFWLCLLLAVCIIFFRLDAPSRAVLIIFGLLSTGLLLVRERFTISYLKRRKQTRESVLLAGTPADMRQLRDTFTAEQLLKMEVVGEIDIESNPISVMVETLHKHSVSRVIFAGGHGHLNRLQEAIGACETEGIEAWLVADFIKTSIARPAFDVLGSRPMLVFRTTPEVSWALLVKGFIDFTGALVLLCLSSPLFVIAAVGIKLTSPGPVIFRQTRAGRHGRPFVMYKFRTMSTDAEMLRAELEAFNQMSGPVFKIENDPRITRFGGWLRKTSIDELPQFINVLLGSMSLVGPRPLPIYEVEKFENTAQRRRLSVKPGLTCLWQIGGRNELKDFHEWVKLDLEYIDNWSIWLDLKILFKTVPVVLLGLGAK